LGKTENDIFDPCLYALEIADDLLVLQEGKYSIPEEYRLSGAIVSRVLQSTAPVEKIPLALHLSLQLSQWRDYQWSLEMPKNHLVEKTQFQGFHFSD